MQFSVCSCPCLCLFCCVLLFLFILFGLDVFVVVCYYLEYVFVCVRVCVRESEREWGTETYSLCLLTYEKR